MTLNLHLPPRNDKLRPNITVIGVGGAGGNAVNNMISSKLEGVSFLAANTDAQALEHSLAEKKIQLGLSVTKGLGAGASPEVGRAAAEEALDEIEGYLQGSNMVFITAGMGGGTGTGAAPVIARLAREMGVLTVGVVTKPFHFEGTHRMRIADYGINELQSFVDTLIVIPNQNLFRIANEKTTFAQAFAMADDVLHSGVRGVTDLMVMPGLINLDFADIRAVMSEMGKAMMGTGEAEGDRRAIEAAEAAISNPLLDEVSMKGARGMLINITGGPDMTLFEVDEAANRVREEVDTDANIIFGATFNDALEGKIRVSVVATGIEAEAAREGGKGSGQVGTGTASSPFRTLRPAAQQPKAASARIKEEQAASSRMVEQAAKPLPLRFSPAPSLAERQVTESQAAPAVKEEAPVAEIKISPAAQQQQESDPGVFIAPKAVEPGNRSNPYARVTQTFERVENIMDQPGEARQRPGGRDSAPPAFRFIQKITGKLGAAGEQAEEMQAEVAEVKEVPVKADKPQTEEDYFDIPAFLRRQAN